MRPSFRELTADALRTAREELRELYGPRFCHRDTVWSRTHLGLSLPGRYYFLTVTSSPESPPIEQDWQPLLHWLRRHVPGLECLHVLTDEGHGVAHLAVRIPREGPRIEVVPLRLWWERRHAATQIRIERVRDRDGLARYLSEQAKKPLSREIAGQSRITSWGYTRGWLPVGFIKAFGSLWYRWFFENPSDDIDPEAFNLIVSAWLRECASEGRITDPPVISAPLASSARGAPATPGGRAVRRGPAGP